jgi:hypothetical protein
MFLIYWDMNQDTQFTQEEMEAQFEAYRAFTAEVRDRGLILNADALQSTATATTVSLSGGKILTTDGPFAETKEQLGGYYVLDCENLDEAIEIAAKIPHAQNGTIEIRPVMEY